MAKLIKIKKGLDINIVGTPQEVEVRTPISSTYGVVPDHYPGLLPKLEVRPGDRVQAGSPIFYNKNFPELKIVSPVSGEIKAVNRGAKRKILSVEIIPDSEISYAEFSSTTGIVNKEREEILNLLLSAGMISLLRERPYDYVPNPRIIPRDIFVTCNITAPLTPDAEVLLRDRFTDVQVAIDALGRLTTGKVYVAVKAGSGIEFNNCEQYEIAGPHPAGNVGVFANHVKPINKGETVWTASATELAIIGNFLRTGKVDFSKTVAAAGERLATTGLMRPIAGANIKELLADKLDNSNANLRLINGDVLTGMLVTDDALFLSPFSNVVTAIPEGDDVHELFGWAVPGFNRYSSSRSYPSSLMKKPFSFDARVKGGERALIVSGEFDKVFPMNIYPEYLLRAIFTFDIDKMEELGIYEVAPEDFALCEFVDTSKNEIQYYVRKALDMLYKEMN